jgi:hypothetical protein
VWRDVTPYNLPYRNRTRSGGLIAEDDEEHRLSVL